MIFKTATIDDIIDWCQKNNQVEWLKAKAKETTTFKVYPRKKVKGEDGKYHHVSDRTANPKIEKHPITFVQIKRDFFMEFFPELLKGKEKKPTMYERINSL